MIGGTLLQDTPGAAKESGALAVLLGKSVVPLRAVGTVGKEELGQQAQAQNTHGA